MVTYLVHSEFPAYRLGDDGSVWSRWKKGKNAQELGGDRPLFYNHLARCMDKVIGDWPFEIHAPAFGSGLAGGDWRVIQALIEDCWIRRCSKATVTVYYLPGTFLPPDA